MYLSQFLQTFYIFIYINFKVNNQTSENHGECDKKKNMKEVGQKVTKNNIIAVYVSKNLILFYF